MHSVLFHLGPLQVRAFGVMLMLAFLAGMAFALPQARRKGIAPEHVIDFTLLALVFGVLGSRLLHIALNWRDYAAAPWSMFKVWEGGLSYHGGWIAVCVAGAVFVRRRKLPLGRFADVMVVSLPLSQAIGRIGCFFNGCCYGSPTDLPWACRFPDEHAANGALTPPSHPAQLYSMLGSLIVFALLVARRNRVRWEGELFWLYAMLFSVQRFLVEFARKGVTAQVMWGGLTQAQVASVGFFVVALAVHQILGRRLPRPPAARGRRSRDRRRAAAEAAKES